jgi:hypothetical protein
MGLILVVLGIVLIIISAFWSPPRVSLWNLGWGLVLAGLLLFGGVGAGLNT